MAVYGKLRRKKTIQNLSILSPTKHVVTTEDSFLESTSSIVSDSLFSVTNDFDPMVSSFETTEQEHNDTFVDDQPSSPLLKSKANVASNIDFFSKDFEELESLESTQPKRMKFSGSKRKNTTIFGNRNTPTLIRETVNINKTNDRNNTSLIEQSHYHPLELSDTLKSLNSRILELQCKVDLQNKEQEDLTVSQMTTLSNRLSDTITRQSTKHYGSTRTFKMEEKNLSEEEEEEENKDEEVVEKEKDMYLSLDREPIHDDSRLVSLGNKCQTLAELRLSADLEASKLEFDIMMEQLQHWLYEDKNATELLTFKLDLISKIKNDVKFNHYIQREFVDKKNNELKPLLSDLLKSSVDLHIVNFELIIFFHVDNWTLSGLEPNIISWMNEIIEAGDITLNIQMQKELRNKKGLIKDIIIDWINSCEENETIFSITLTMIELLGFEEFKKLTTKARNTIILFLSSILESNNTGLYSRCLKILETGVLSVPNTDIKCITKLLTNKFFERKDNNALDLTQLLKCCIIISCNSYTDDTKEIHDLVMNNRIWGKLWEIVNEHDILLKKSKEHDTAQCLYALGYIFNYISNESSITDKSQLIHMKKLIGLVSDSQHKNYENTYQIHCFGYLGCIAYFFLKKFDLLTGEDIQKIKYLLSTFKMLVNQNGNENENVLNDRIDQILQVI